MYATYLLVMCRSQYPPNFSGKKTVRIKIQYLALKKNILFMVSTRNDNISRGCATKTEFLEGRGGSVLGVNFWKIQRAGGGGGGMDIFWNYTMAQNRAFCTLG